VQIKIVSRPPKAFAPDAICYFLDPENKIDYQAQPPRISQAVKDHSDPPFVTAIDGRLAFQFYLPRYKYYEQAEARRIAGGMAVRQMRKAGVHKLAWILDGVVPLAHFREFVTGAQLAAYVFDRYKSTKFPGLAKEQLTIVAGDNSALFRRELERLAAVDAGVRTARDLANTPAGDLVPLELAERARKLAREFGLVFRSLSAAQLAARGYVGLTNVGRGSVNPPVMFTLGYKPEKQKRSAKPLCLVGKGVCFDAGGIDLKPWDGMWDMKADMGGAAAVIGAMQAIALLKPAVPVCAVIAAAQNLPDGKAFLPSDVLRYRNGRTVEIQNTDAEGRLVLADALLYAQSTLRQRRILDFATLTGACARALGKHYIGLLSRSPELKAAVLHAAELSGENVWELPLHPEYRLQLKSSVADVRNIGGPLAGAQTAGWFLHEFIEPHTEYVHLDIAGTYVNEDAKKYWSQPGMTGSGTRLAIALAELSAG